MMWAWLRSLFRPNYGKPVEGSRSGLWPAVRKAHLRVEPRCQWCGSTWFVQVHHVYPFHLYPERELDPHWLISLCEPPGSSGCHLSRGHRGRWTDYDPDIRRKCEEHRRG